jgi:flagellar assembly factor FliW
LSYSIAQRPKDLTSREETEEGNEVNLKIVTQQFGELEFDENIVYHFQDGLPGFEELREFVIISDQDTEPLKWLLSIQDPDVGFPILEMSLIKPELYNEISDVNIETCTVFGIVTLNHEPKPATVNLKAPVIVNNSTKSGKQIIINSDKYSTDFEIR